MELSRRRTEASVWPLRRRFPGQVVRDKPPFTADHVRAMYGGFSADVQAPGSDPRTASVKKNAAKPAKQLAVLSQFS